MDQFQKQLITRQFYLQQMGAISLKADKAAKRIVVPKDAQPEEQVPTEDLGSEDSLSETRPLPADSDDVTSESDAEDPLSADPVLQLGKKKPATAAKTVKKPAEANRKQLCPVCKRGFQLRRLPPLHISCSKCKLLVHKRCLKDSSSTLCVACESDVVNVSVAAACPPQGSPRPASVPSSLGASVPSADCCDELLLSEGKVRFSCLPSYQSAERKFDERMTFLGFERSPSQPCTLGDGNCGVYGLLDQLNLPTSDPMPRFDRDEALFAR